VESTIDRDGVKLHYWVEGLKSAPLVLLTHGVSMDHRMWEPQVTELSRRYRVVTWDVRGHGLSVCSPSEFSAQAAATDLVALLDALGVDDVALVGHSLGATISQIVALEHPGRIRAFAGIGCACITMRPSASMRLFSRFAPSMARWMGPARMREDAARRAGVAEQTRAYARQAAGAMNDEMFEAAVSVGFGDCVELPAYHIGMPLLLLRGDKDGYGFLLSSAQRWAQRDGGEFALVPSAAHNAGQDNPGFVNARLSQFLESC
jgi:pimeloyl-ACP methyl ester carboxylesterase